MIVAILTDQDLMYLSKVANSLGLTVLVEVHDAEELERVLNLGGFPLIGINNRDLTTFETDLETTETLSKQFATRLQQQGVLLVSESGLFNRADLDRVEAVGAEAVLVGEALMRQSDVCAGLRKLIEG